MSLPDKFKIRSREEIVTHIAQGYTRQIFELTIQTNQLKDKIVELTQENTKLKETIQQMSGVDVK